MTSTHGKADGRYQITADAPPALRERSAYSIIQQKIKQQPELEKRLTAPNHRIPDTDWSYGSQTYLNRDVMLHLIAMQIKAMADRGAIEDIETIFDPKYGIGSKSHKDKGTIKNPLSFWGHPTQTEILGQRSKWKALAVYHAFRKTIKNDLIRYARTQALEWHLQPTQQKLDDIMNFLEQNQAAATKQLRQDLIKYKLPLETLIERALMTHLLS